ncbi:acyl-CoA dehydrogenase [Caulobacter vibrioides]|uniref:Acyl-CoA dehydrogenase family protein n=2 Tax=Caulobacter vibrioides TaxID=155892 RepID=Q9A5G9_CAUVC|nr:MULTISPECIES: acyl-CoA dehydrogenase family protein [Caulobacter]YP_002517936.1 acyl-CoA dehydrogenase [Caulobacter vibrioides NA1000]AAK24449.1 acyl-CoA dehydrogenase family protein [Caulobacter vibrioides CB15]ACL96028.1 acyl-CoA dehydrogenase [Caulobacter vibrioides NA1000]ATC25466.1 acyl-CoA dehydrogenase [Caulobacter vibrioides]ATC29330.1 acyl-CoA dehydrogenase [Caulobacter vibrioides]AZH13560.1 acyl-CoA dehydrogenase [Caulobacter vibrioides]
MDFNDSTEEAAYREKARAWLAENAAAHRAKWGELKPNTPEHMAAAKEWQATKASAGYACITWPAAIGGGGGTPIQSVIFGQEETKAGLGYGYFTIGLGMCVPTVMAFSDGETKKRFVSPAVRGEEIWCQLFSEPAGGSDVAALRTRAVKDGDEWVINGQKVWTTGAHYCDYGILLTRTDPDVPKHKGLTMFWIDMKDPAVECRPIHQMSGGREFNEVYFTDLRVKDSQRLGEVGDGWKVALVTLMNERLAVGGSAGPNYREIMKLARELAGPTGPSLKDQSFREKLADWYVQSEGLKFTRFRTMTALSRGQTPGPESSIGKIISANQLQELANTAVEMEDQYGILSDPEVAPAEAAFQQSLMWAPGLRIAGGTDEILKNIIAERVLGLPGDVRVDKDVAFKDMPTGR